MVEYQAFVRSVKNVHFLYLGLSLRKRQTFLGVKIQNFLDKTDCIKNSKYGLKECVSFVNIWKKVRQKLYSCITFCIFAHDETNRCLQELLSRVYGKALGAGARKNQACIIVV